MPASNSSRSLAIAGRATYRHNRSNCARSRAGTHTDRPSTIAAISKAGGATVDAATLARLNGVDPTTSLPEGWSVKPPVVVEARPRG